jgi:hypothetical protein
VHSQTPQAAIDVQRVHVVLEKTANGVHDLSGKKWLSGYIQAIFAPEY